MRQLLIAFALLGVAGTAHAQPLTRTPPAEAVEAVTHSIDGTLTFTMPPIFALAVTQEQVMVEGVIPPCDADFDYCLYIPEALFAGTNFENAGLRIKHRTDLTTREACLAEQPAGYTGIVPVTVEAAVYATALFPGLGDAGAGHYSSGDLYRLFAAERCYEFETRIGQTQIGNYEPGAVRPFTPEDETTVQTAFRALLDSVTLAGGETKLFPEREP
jgi:hypothetical protein